MVCIGTHTLVIKYKPILTRVEITEKNQKKVVIFKRIGQFVGPKYGHRHNEMIFHEA